MIAIIGCGTLGSRVAQLLAQHELLLIDHDIIKEENLPQQLYNKEEVGMHKARVLAKRHGGKAIKEFLDSTNTKLLQEAEVVIDCTDNLLTRKIIGQYCHKEGIPLVHGAVAKDRGLTALFVGKPCLASIYKDKVSVDDCRSADINLAIADKVAESQSELALRALAEGLHDGIHLITEDEERVIRVSDQAHKNCEEETPAKNYYLTYCSAAGCMTARPMKKTKRKRKKGILEGVHYEVIPNGEVRFYTPAEVDHLAKIAERLMHPE